NPCRDQCELSFVLEQEKQVSISMFDAQGKLIQQIQQAGNLAMGVYRFHLETTALPSGIYSIQVDMNGEKQLLKMVKNE
ncbi:MAG: T9SS type A sorting domain-containing protein, partial [Bacteroidia bacterium]